METFKKGYSFFIWDSLPAAWENEWAKRSRFSRGCEREKLFLLHLFYLPLLRNNKQKCFMDFKLFKTECNCLKVVFLFLFGFFLFSVRMQNRNFLHLVIFQNEPQDLSRSSENIFDLRKKIGLENILISLEITYETHKGLA